MLPKEKLQNLYKKGLSMQEVADKTGWEYSQVRYWMARYKILRRSRSKAVYLKNNPQGDPFKIKKLSSKKDFELYNLGIGLFLGEGTKKNKFSVILANSNPNIVSLFLRFLRETCGAKEDKIRAWLNIFDDVDANETMRFWSEKTNIPMNRFNKTTIRKGKKGSYKNKSRYGTISVFITNIKLKELMDKWCEKALSHNLPR